MGVEEEEAAANIRIFADLVKRSPLPLKRALVQRFVDRLVERGLKQAVGIVVAYLVQSCNGETLEGLTAYLVTEAEAQQNAEVMAAVPPNSFKM